jgi:hypothetical protein
MSKRKSGKQYKQERKNRKFRREVKSFDYNVRLMVELTGDDRAIMESDNG